MDRITYTLKTTLELPPTERFKRIWKNELEQAIEKEQDLLPPEFEIERPRKKRKVVAKSKRKTTHKKGRK